MAATLHTLALYWLNGLLALLYGYLDHWAAYTALGLAALAALLVDYPQARVAGYQPLRYGRGRTPTVARSWPVFPLGLGLLWTLGAVLTPPPFPYIGLAMWLVAIVLPLVIPLEQRDSSYKLRWALGGYAAALLAARLLYGSLNLADIARWTAHLQTLDSQAALAWAARTTLANAAYYALAYGVPVGYGLYAYGLLATHRRTWRNPFTPWDQTMAELRGRGED